MKKIGIVIFIVFLGASARANAFSPNVGIKAGLALSNFWFSKEIEEAWKYLVSYRIGAFVNFRVSKDFYLQPEVLWGRNGARFKAAYEDSEASVREHIDYLEFPLLLKMRFPLSNDFSLGLLGGGFGAVNIGAKSFFEYEGETSEEDIKKEIKDIDFGIVFGAELEWKKWALDIRYVMGLTNIKDYDFRSYSVKNQALTVLLGYHF
jgi:hypothetical protein